MAESANQNGLFEVTDRVDGFRKKVHTRILLRIIESKNRFKKNGSNRNCLFPQNSERMMGGMHEHLNVNVDN